jgi:hypothetical protein
MTRWIPLLTLLLPLMATADIYKCRLPNGKLEISNTPCPTGSGTVTVRPEEKVPDAARQQAERDVERMKEYVDKREAAQRADEAAAREERASQRQGAAAGLPPRQYGDPAACLRALDQQALEANQRSQLEAECRSLVKPSAEVQPVYVPIVSPPHFRPHRPPPPPPPARPAEPSGPAIIFCPPASKNCSR